MTVDSICLIKLSRSAFGMLDTAFEAGRQSGLANRLDTVGKRLRRCLTIWLDAMK